MKNMTGTRARLYYIDWLRVLAMVTIFFFHNSRFFDDNTWHVSNADTSIVAAIFVQFCNLWLMPLFFILAGASIYYALRVRTAGGFTKERILRILIPIVILGWFIIAPPQIYLERLSHGDFSGNFFQFYSSQYFDGFYGIGGNFGLVPLHMWFLWLLLIYSLILLPLFLPNKETGRSLGSKLSILLEKPWTFVVPVVFLVVTEVFLDFVEWGGWLEPYLVPGVLCQRISDVLQYKDSGKHKEVCRNSPYCGSSFTGHALFTAVWNNTNRYSR
ncbi:acyltransferase family protein [Chloroflexota bacterium]